MPLKNIATIAAAAALAVPLVVMQPTPAGMLSAQASVSTASITPVSASKIEKVRAVILQQTNAQRAAYGLAPLTLAPWMNRRGQACSEQQAEQRRMAHCSAPASFGRAWAENVASGQHSERVVAAWMASPGHRANILNPRYSEMGVGFAMDSSGRTYFTQNFRQP